MLKVELHTHTADDPEDYIPHTARELIDRATALGFGGLAITLHSRQFESADVTAYARDRGLALVPGVEVSIGGRHVLLLNYPPAARAEDVRSFEDLGRLRQRARGLVVAPHPYYPASSCLGHALEEHAELFDAVEISGFYTRWIDFNAKAWEWARAIGKPLVGNGDVHRLGMLGPTYSLVDAPADSAAICEAIRTGRVEVRTRPISGPTMVYRLAQLAHGDVRRLAWQITRRTHRPST